LRALKKKLQVEPNSSQKYMVPVVRSTFKVLEELSHSGALGLAEITERTGISKSTVFRILSTLTSLGYIVRDEDRNYFVSHTMGDLVSAEAGIEAIRRTAMPHMLALRDRFGETVNLGHIQVDKITYIEVVPSEYALRLHERPGATVCLHASALGKAILAYSDEDLATSLLAGRELQMLTRHTITDPTELMAEIRRARERGYAFDRGETSTLATCVAAPIVNAAGTAVAGISISGPTSRFNPRKDSPVIENLLKAAAEISKQLRTRGGESTNRGGRRRIGASAMSSRSTR
jgi:DNA-binding IclR family transcriptional regulator